MTTNWRLDKARPRPSMIPLHLTLIFEAYNVIPAHKSTIYHAFESKSRGPAPPVAKDFVATAPSSVKAPPGCLCCTSDAGHQVLGPSRQTSDPRAPSVDARAFASQTRLPAARRPNPFLAPQTSPARWGQSEGCLRQIHLVTAQARNMRLYGLELAERPDAGTLVAISLYLTWTRISASEVASSSSKKPSERAKGLPLGALGSLKR